VERRHFGGPALQVNRPQGRVGIECAVVERLELAVGFDALVQSGDHRLADPIIGPVERRPDRRRQQQPIRDATDEIAHRARTDEGQEQVSAAADAVEGQRVAEAVAVMRQADIPALGDVEQASDADRRVDAEADKRLDRLADLELEEVVGEDHRLVEVAERVAQPGAQRLRHDRLVPHRRRADDSLVE